MGDQGFRLFGIVVMPTRGILAGTVAADNGEKKHVDCVSSMRGLSARVLWIDRSGIQMADAKTACQWVLDGVRYTTQFTDERLLPEIQYRLFLVPSGQSAEVRSISWTPFGRLHPTYLAHWGKDTAETRAFIVGTYAHESMHVLTTVLDIEVPDDVNEEQVGYLTSACAVLVQTGVLRAKDILRSRLRRGEWNMPASAARSLGKL